jgi:hypothetical protein
MDSPPSWSNSQENGNESPEKQDEIHGLRHPHQAFITLRIPAADASAYTKIELARKRRNEVSVNIGHGRDDSFAAAPSN